MNIQKQFEDFNNRFFNNRLKGWTVEESNIFGLGYCCQGEKRIYVGAESGDKEEYLRVLAHEMAHASVRGGHTSKWLKEIQRIAKLGAPVLPDEEENAVDDEEMNFELEAEEGDSSSLLAECCDVCRARDTAKLAKARTKLGKKCLLHHSVCENDVCEEHKDSK
jgi:hypothetical protein